MCLALGTHPFLDGTSVSAVGTNNKHAKSTGKVLKEILRVGGYGEMAGKLIRDGLSDLFSKLRLGK